MPEGARGSLALNATSKSFSLLIGGMLLASRLTLNLKPWPSASSFKCLMISLNCSSHKFILSCKVDMKVSTELKLMSLKLMSTNGTCALLPTSLQSSFCQIDWSHHNIHAWNARNSAQEKAYLIATIKEI